MDTITKFVKTYFDFNYGIGVLLFFLFFILYLYVPRYGKRKAMTKETVLGGVLFCGYLVLVFGVTLLNRSPRERISLELQPFWSYLRTWQKGDRALGQQIFYNILAFIPMGLMLPLLYPGMRLVKRTVPVGCLTSVFIEVNQLLWHRGLCELDDVMNNTLGTLIGYGIYRGITGFLDYRKEKKRW